MLSSLGNQSCLSVNTWNLNLHHQAFIEHLLNGSVTGLVLQETDRSRFQCRTFIRECSGSALWMGRGIREG